MYAQEGIPASDHAYKETARPFDERGQDFDLRGFTALGEAEDNVFRAYHAQVSVNSVGSVQETGRRTGRVQRGHYFLRHNSAFAYTGDNGPAVGAIQGQDRRYEVSVQRCGESSQCFCFNLQGASGRM